MRQGRMVVGLSKGTVLLATAFWTVMPVGTVMADDAGVRAFFRQESGAEAVPQPTYDSPSTSRPLIVRPHRRTAARKPQTKVAVGPTIPVSIYDDPTLRPGDAVMTAKGLRVFMGAHSAPYTDADFVALSDVDGLPKQVEKALVLIDKAPHG